ncbi:MAG: hypothetical protein AB2696_21150 [Candidatus Thiodiazotropha sp.]
MTEVDILTAMGSSVVTGAVAAMTTVKALKVHITYIREKLAEHGEAIKRAHERITELDSELDKCRLSCKVTLQKLHPGADV